MNLKFNALKFGILFFSLVQVSCNKDERQAEDSMVGTWNVVEINSFYGDFSQNGFNPSETISEEGQLGDFDFDEDLVTYSFTRNDTLYMGNAPWDISTEKVNAGFTKVTEFTLTIEDHFIFNVDFEDETKNSEKDARKATFTNMPNSGNGVLIELFLEKS